MLKTEDFLAALTLAAHATLPDEPFNKILLDGDQMAAYNGMTGIILPFTTNLYGAVQADSLIRPLRHFTSEELDISTKKKYLTIKSGKKETLKTPIVEDSDAQFAFLNNRTNFFTDLPDNFEKSVAICGITSGGAVLKEYVQGIYFIDGNAYSTNDAALSEVQLEGEVDNFFLHNNALPVLDRVSPLSIGFTDKTIVFKCLDDIEVICPLFSDYKDFPYPSHRKIIDGFKKQYKLPEGFSDSIAKALSVLHSSRAKLISLGFKSTTLTLKTTNDLTGTTLTESAGLSEEHKKDEFKLDPELLSKLPLSECDLFAVNNSGFKLISTANNMQCVFAKLNV